VPSESSERPRDAASTTLLRCERGERREQPAARARTARLEAESYRYCAYNPVAHVFSYWATNDNLAALDLHIPLFCAATYYPCLVGIAHG
jgi:hypothetical protein